MLFLEYQISMEFHALIKIRHLYNKKKDQYTSSFKSKIQKCPWKFSKVPPLNTLYFYAKSKLYLSCTLAHTSTSISLNSKARQLLPSIASEDHQFRRDLPSSRWKMLKIVSPSHCFQPPTPEVFSPLPTPEVARRSSPFFFFFFTEMCFVFKKNGIYIYMFDKMLQWRWLR